MIEGTFGFGLEVNKEQSQKMDIGEWGANENIKLGKRRR
jgi:hypothetical protein